ncbi:hypothetical protein JOQ06_000347, partial [Pogonophryne albipinna]
FVFELSTDEKSESPLRVVKLQQSTRGSIGRKPALIVLMSLFGEALISPSASPQRHERPSDFQRIWLSETHSGWADLTGP